MTNGTKELVGKNHVCLTMETHDEGWTVLVLDLDSPSNSAYIGGVRSCRGGGWRGFCRHGHIQPVEPHNNPPSEFVEIVRKKIK